MLFCRPSPRTLVIRPSGPVPLTSPSGTPRSSAIFLASGLAKNLGLSPLSSGAFCASVPPPEPYFFSSCGVCRAEVVPDEVGLGSSALLLAWLSGCASFLGSSFAGAGASDSPASLSAPERSSPSSPMMAMVAPTWIDLAPSFCCGQRRNMVEVGQASRGTPGGRGRVWGHPLLACWTNKPPSSTLIVSSPLRPCPRPPFASSTRGFDNSR